MSSYSSVSAVFSEKRLAASALFLVRHAERRLESAIRSSLCGHSLESPLSAEAEPSVQDVHVTLDLHKTRPEEVVCIYFVLSRLRAFFLFDRLTEWRHGPEHASEGSRPQKQRLRRRVSSDRRVEGGDHVPNSVLRLRWTVDLKFRADLGKYATAASASLCVFGQDLSKSNHFLHARSIGIVPGKGSVPRRGVWLLMGQVKEFVLGGGDNVEPEWCKGSYSSESEQKSAVKRVALAFASAFNRCCRGPALEGGSHSEELCQLERTFDVEEWDEPVHRLTLSCPGFSRSIFQPLLDAARDERRDRVVLAIVAGLYEHNRGSTTCSATHSRPSLPREIVKRILAEAVGTAPASDGGASMGWIRATYARSVCCYACAPAVSCPTARAWWHHSFEDCPLPLWTRSLGLVGNATSGKLEASHTFCGRRVSWRSRPLADYYRASTSELGD
eukprot:scaffold2959_cov388-Prasinococcus_capsulatus_cf.AAC.2